ncbi:MAG: SDR family NAD(P)-dependent oxidoreductase [Thermodesulfobacteriota bacterium]
MSKLKGKTALITGGGTGIGKATAHLFAKEGADVFITGRREEKLKEVQQEAKSLGIDIGYFAADVSVESDCENVVKQIIDQKGKIDILFNNAGILIPGTTHETSTEIWDTIFNINVKGTYFMSKYTIPHMLEKGKGVIVNNSSVVGLKGFPGLAAYVASKGAVTQLTKSMALEYADKGIRVNAICPGAIETPMVIDDFFGKVEDPEAARNYLVSLHPAGRLGQSDEIANAVLFLCDDNIGFMTGNMLSVDGGWIAK